MLIINFILLLMTNEREYELLQRRDEILRETMELTSNVLQSLEQQKQLASNTKENLHNQNFLLSLANDKMRTMNEDLTSVVNEMNELDVQPCCLCCSRKKKKKKKKITPTINSKPISSQTEINEKPQDISLISELINNNEQEKLITNELNQMKTQLLVFQDQVKTINKSLDEGDEIIHQLGNESNRYMNASSY